MLHIVLSLLSLENLKAVGIKKPTYKQYWIKCAGNTLEWVMDEDN